MIENKDNVFKVYSGRRGCMCGCIGNYRYASHHVEYGSKERGYGVSEDEVSDRQVSRVVNKINANSQDCERDGNVIYLETETRIYAAYVV
jgi:hypothetical protein